VPAGRISEDAENLVIASLAAGSSVREAASRGGVSFDAAARVKRERDAADVPQSAADVPIGTPGETDGGPVSVSESGDSRVVAFQSDRPVYTLEDALALADVDLAVWYVERWEAGGWQVGMKVKEYAGGKKTGETPTTKQLWSVKLHLKRIAPRAVLGALSGLFDRMADHAPNYSRAARLVAPADPHLCVFDLVDVHFGKLAWAREAGQDYDLRIADTLYRDAVRDVVGRCSHMQIDEFLVPLGSDLLHVDNAGGTTTAGTPQDVDGRLAKILETAQAAVIYAVEEMATRGRVVLRWVPGNHDRVLSWGLANAVKAWFRSHDRVTVDVEPTTRKYHRYHRTLIGLTHGNEEKHSSLPTIMAQERPQDWAETDCREWHVGHLHQSRRLDFMALDTHGGVPVRTLRSLSATDAWHYRKGYVGSQRAAEAYFYDRRGFVGFQCANVRD
jgi:hypothetical protein